MQFSSWISAHVGAYSGDYRKFLTLKDFRSMVWVRIIKFMLSYFVVVVVVVDVCSGLCTFNCLFSFLPDINSHLKLSHCGLSCIGVG